MAVDIVDMLCAVGQQSPIRYRWRPALPDPGDDFLLELAVAARCEYIVTHNLRDFDGAQAFGIHTLTPGQFLEIMEEANE